MPATPSQQDAGRTLLIEMYQAAVAAAAPGPVLRAALDKSRQTAAGRVWIIAIGKAAHAMATAAVQALKEQGAQPAGGIIIAPKAAVPPHPSLSIAVGSHPIPGPRSFTAAARLGDLVGRVREGEEAWVLLSGGASSLMAAPEGAIKPDELVELYTVLLASGLDIKSVNTIRKRFSRWGAGRLAKALSHAKVRVFIISDVVGDDMATIGSGPCIADDSTASDVRDLLMRGGIWDKTPGTMRRSLAIIERDDSLETPKPGDDIFWNVERKLIGSNRLALDAAAAAARKNGFEAVIVTASLTGNAADAGQRIAAQLVSYRDAMAAAPPKGGRGICLIWGGETTVTLGALQAHQGGRCQELALAAALELSRAPPSNARVALLAAGTDGRDGPTDAAGAIVDTESWDTIRRTGRDPEMDLLLHDSYPALDAGGALLRTGLTGTNVMDVVLAVAQLPR